MRVGQGVLRWFGAHAFHLPHPSKRRVFHLVGFTLAAALMLTGAAGALGGDEMISAIGPLPVLGVPIPHIVWDAAAWTLHGFGAIPFFLHGEKLWKLLITFDPTLEETSSARLSQHHAGRSMVRKKARKR